jgi:hypothetical protein
MFRETGHRRSVMGRIRPKTIRKKKVGGRGDSIQKNIKQCGPQHGPQMRGSIFFFFYSRQTRTSTSGPNTSNGSKKKKNARSINSGGLFLNAFRINRPAAALALIGGVGDTSASKKAQLEQQIRDLPPHTAKVPHCKKKLCRLRAGGRQKSGDHTRSAPARCEDGTDVRKTDSLTY